MSDLALRYVRKTPGGELRARPGGRARADDLRRAEGRAVAGRMPACRALRSRIPLARAAGHARLRGYGGGIMRVALPPGRFSGLLLKVNVFLLIALVMVGAFMGLVAYKQGWFVHQSPLHFVTPNALGINKGMPVKLHGFTIGQVSDLQLTSAGVDVRLSIVSGYLARIP